MKTIKTTRGNLFAQAQAAAVGGVWEDVLACQKRLLVEGDLGVVGRGISQILVSVDNPTIEHFPYMVLLQSPCKGSHFEFAFNALKHDPDPRARQKASIGDLDPDALLELTPGQEIYLYITDV